MHQRTADSYAANLTSSLVAPSQDQMQEVHSMEEEEKKEVTIDQPEEEVQEFSSLAAPCQDQLQEVNAIEEEEKKEAISDQSEKEESKDNAQENEMLAMRYHEDFNKYYRCY